MEITWEGDAGYWGSIHVATVFYNITRAKGDDHSTWRAVIHLPAGREKEFTTKTFATCEDGRGHCQRIADAWLKKSGLQPAK